MYKKKNNIFLCVSVLMGCILFLIPSIAIERHNLSNNLSEAERAENIILMIPDNQAFSNVIEARILLNAINGDVYYQETLEDIGYKKYEEPRFINSKKSKSTEDSPALPTVKNFNNNESYNKEDSSAGEYTNLISTFLELANAKGKATGIVVTSGIFCASHSTFADGPGSFDCGTDMARRYIEDFKFDVIFGGGLSGPNFSKEKTYAGSSQQIDYHFDISGLDMFKGYKCISNNTEMEAAVADGVKKILGIFGTEQDYPCSGKTPELFRIDSSDYPDGEPTLPEMTVAAMNILEKACNGFLLLIEGTQFNRGNYENEMEYILAESLAFDKSVNEVLDWVHESPDRENNTLVVVISDHNCADMSLNASTGGLSEPGGSDTIYSSPTRRYFKADETIIFTQGPGSEKLYAAFNNADLYDIMEVVLN